MKNLVIVESPAKAKTIEGYLGKDFIVKSSFGHVRDLPKGDKAIDIQNNYKPVYEVTEDKKDVVSQLRKLAKQAETVWLATDDDREGEAISWHLKEALDLKDSHIKRIVFREITKTAILKAIENPRSIDIDLVNAQQARRVLDRLVGFELSPVLWKKIKSGLSAGRVQSVAVRFVVEREREINHFLIDSAFQIKSLFDLEKGKNLTALLPKKIKQEDDAMALLQDCNGAVFSIADLETKPAKRSPAPPFTTSTLQQEASRKLSFSVAQTMTLAQRLYEAGHISYMRTDSVNLSETAIEGALSEINAAYGAEFAQKRVYKTKSENAQEAHEAIRPTDFGKHAAGGERNEQRLYDLIWKRAIASQMADARLEKTTARIHISTRPEELIASGEVIRFEGFLKVYIEDSDEEQDPEAPNGALPPLVVGQILPLNTLLATQRFSQPPARYTEASLVKKLEEAGIGRPSTYAPTISTIQKREYVIKDFREGTSRGYTQLMLRAGKISKELKTEITGAEKAKLFPTDIGLVVNDFLVQHFPGVVDYSFTAQVEKEFDQISEGKLEWTKMIDVFYKDFHPSVEQTAQLDRASTGALRKIGFHPQTGKEVIARLGRYGPVIQIGNTEQDEKVQFASLLKNQSIETIDLEQALELFKLPRIVGHYLDEEVVAGVGRFGPYLRYAGKFYPLPKPEEPLAVGLERSIEVIEQKQLAEAQKIIKSFAENADVKVLNGRYGPYIVANGENIKIPKGEQPQDLSLERCLELFEQAPKTTKFKGKKPVAGAKKLVDPAAKAAPKTKRAAAPKAASATSKPVVTTKPPATRKTAASSKTTVKKKSDQ